MKDVYFDLHLLERYVSAAHADAGIALVMNDLERLVHPKKKDSKCWRYDISHGAQFGEERFTTPIGGKEIDFALDQRYSLAWVNHGAFWFLETGISG